MKTGHTCNGSYEFTKWKKRKPSDNQTIRFKLINSVHLNKNDIRSISARQANDREIKDILKLNVLSTFRLSENVKIHYCTV